MSGEAEQAAEDAVVALLTRTSDRTAACAALLRLAGEALARLASHDRAASVHAQLARRHAQHAARCWRP